MKKMWMIAMLAATVFGLQAANPVFRVDVDARAGKISLKALPSDDMSGDNPGWVKVENGREFNLCFWSKAKVNDLKWEDYEISFIPSKSGKLTIAVRGQWAAKAQDQAWVLINKIELNDKLYPNGDFKKVTKKQDGKLIPDGFSLGKNAKYLPTVGEKGTPAILVNHDNPLVFTMQVEAGKKYEIEFDVKAATPDLLK